MRKKQRHEQLLHSEEMLVKMNNAEELKNKRCQNIFRFLSLRGYMLMHTSMEEEDKGGNDGGDGGASQNLAHAVACTSLLSEVVKDMDHFTFKSNVGVTMMRPTEQHKSKEVRLAPLFALNGHIC